MKTWTGGSSVTSNWSDPANWSGGVPQSGDDLVFPFGAPRTSSNNDLPGLDLRSLGFPRTDTQTQPNSGYFISGLAIKLDNGISGGLTSVSISLPITLAADQIWSGNTFLTQSGVISGPYGITIGPGSASAPTFTADNTYTGTTRLDASRLEIRGYQPSSPIVLSGQGSELRGFGTTGSVTVDPNSVLAAVNVSDRRLHVAGDLTMGPGRLLLFAPDGGSALGTVYVDGNVKLGSDSQQFGSSRLEFSFHGNSELLPANASYTLIHKDGSGPVDGVFWQANQVLREGATAIAYFADKTVPFVISYKGGDGNDVTITRIVDSQPVDSPIYFALGDSIPSGHGLKGAGPTPYLDAPCKRSSFGYPAQVENSLRRVMLIGSQAQLGHYNLSCSGVPSASIRKQAHEAAAIIGDNRSTSSTNAYVSLDGGIDDFNFADPVTLGHLFCDSGADFNRWTSNILADVRLNLTAGAIEILKSGRVHLAIQGYYNPIGFSLLHPLLELGAADSVVRCPVFGPLAPAIVIIRQVIAMVRADSVTTQLNETLRSVVQTARTKATAGDRVVFTDISGLFRGHTSCGGDGYVQPFNLATILNGDGDDCVHPNAVGAGVIAAAVFKALAS